MFFQAFAVFVQAGLPGPSYGRIPETIRVLVLKEAGPLEMRAGGRVWRVSAGPPGFVYVNGRERGVPARFFPENGVVRIDGRPYRGDIEVFEDGRQLSVIDELDVEAYVAGIINNEISSKWPQEAVKAQAVVARTYAIYQKKRAKAGALYDVEGSVMGQVYNGAGAEDGRALAAVNMTRGEILAYNGEPALTVYHSNAGGMTDSAKDIWARYYPYLNSVASPYDSLAPNFSWEFTLPASALEDLLDSSGMSVGRPEAIYPEDVLASGRVKTLIIKGADGRALRLTGEGLRRIIGYAALKSAVFEVTSGQGLFSFRGRGSGHGVGLSQWGAKGMAGNGYSYKEILRHYYPGTGIMKAY